MAETSYEKNVAPGKIINRGEFDSGIYLCMTLDELELGAHITERHKLSLTERALFDGDSSLPPEKRPFAEDKTVVVVANQDNEISVADLYKVGDEVISGESRSYVLTPEGWIAPEEGLSAEAMRDPVEGSITGYFMNFDGLRDDEWEEEARRAKVLAAPRVAASAISGSVEPLQYQ